MSKDKPYKKKPAVVVTIKNKISPLTGKEGYLVLVTVLKVNKFNCFFYYSHEDAVKVASIMDLIMNSFSHKQWNSYLKKEGNDGYPQGLIPKEVFNQANEVPGVITKDYDTMEVVAYSEHTLAKSLGYCPPEHDTLEVKIPMRARIPKDMIELMKKDNEICKENEWLIMWTQATIERLETRRKIENDLVEDRVKSGIDRELAELNVYEATQELIRKNGGWR